MCYEWVTEITCRNCGHTWREGFHSEACADNCGIYDERIEGHSTGECCSPSPPLTNGV